MQEEFSRAAMLIGEDGIKTLRQKTVLLFGLGGVGSYVAEALARGGIGKLILVDNDTVNITNINRQLIALHSTIGQPKTAVTATRIHDICPQTQVVTHDLFYLPETADAIPFDGVDYIVDAIDTVTGKLEIAVRAQAAAVPLISCMGTGNKLDPSKLVITDIYKTDTCPLAKIMRRELKARGIKALKVVYSTEPAIKPSVPADGSRPTPGSVSFVPSAAGLLAAAQVIKDLLNISERPHG